MDGQYTKPNPPSAQNVTLVPPTSSPKEERDGIKPHPHPPILAPRVLPLVKNLAMPPSHRVISPGRMELDDHETVAFTAESNLKAIGLDLEIDTA